MKHATFVALVLFFRASATLAAEKPPIYLWFEPEWFAGVEGRFAYYGGASKPTGTWGIAGPGISAEWTQGGESEWNSMGAAAEETAAQCRRELVVPRAGRYKVWVRYVDHRKATEPFKVQIEQAGKPAIAGELGVQPVVPPGDEYELYWGFSFGWGAVEGQLKDGPAKLTLKIDKPGQAWRQVDAVLVTDDLNYQPIGREKPPFAYTSTMNLTPGDAAAWRGSAKNLAVGKAWQRPRPAQRDFSMWTGVDADAKWWGAQNLDQLSRYDVFFQGTPPRDIRDKFHQEFAGRKDLPIMTWPHLQPGFHLGIDPDFSPGTPLRKWFERTKTPFYLLTNYSKGKYTDDTGPATYQALTGPLANQFLGYVHGEAVGTGGMKFLDAPHGNRRQHVDATAKSLLQQQAQGWSEIYHTAVPERHWSKGISCLSVDSIALAHLFHDMGSELVGYEEDATNVHVPMRIAFERGAARQYGGGWINYASGNFGDACNYFTQNPVVPRGAGGWFHSKYAVTDGVSISWYRKLYYLNYLGGATAIFWEQGLANQWMLPGPGKHPIQLSPFGRATVDFQDFVSRLPDRGEPYTPVAFLLSYGHAYERVNYHCKMLSVFPENKADLELRELFNVAWYPAGILEGEPAAPDVQSLPSSTYGNIFDVLVDRPAKREPIFNYPVVWAAGDVVLDGPWPATLQEYVTRGGTLVVNVEAARKLPETLLGVKLSAIKTVSETWSADGTTWRKTTPYEVVRATLSNAKPLAWASENEKLPLVTQHQLGEGKVLLALVPHMLGLDERAHEALPLVMNGVTAGLLPIEVLLADGSRPQGEILYQVNRTKDGYLVLLVNNRGIDKTQHGVARVDRRAVADVMVRTTLPIKSAKEYTMDREVKLEKNAAGQEAHYVFIPATFKVPYLVTQ